jgi:hypothetical protein
MTPQISGADRIQGSACKFIGKLCSNVGSKPCCWFLSANDIGSRRELSTRGLLVLDCWTDVPVVLAEALSTDPPREIRSVLHCAAFRRPISRLDLAISTRHQGYLTECPLIQTILQFPPFRGTG